MILIDGQKVTIGGGEFTMPPLNVKLLKQFQADLDTLTNPEAVKELGVTGFALKAIPVIHANLKRNYPDMTLDELEDRLPVSDVAEVVRAMFRVSGFEGGRRPLEVPESVQVQASPSTGKPSSGNS